MPVEKKRNLVIPLNNPRRPSLWVRLVIAIIRPPLLVIGFVVGHLYDLCFGWLDKRLARQHEQRFAEDIRANLSFLFSEHAAEIIPNEGTPFPPPFDGAYVTVAVGNLLLRFVRGRGDFSVEVASSFAPQDWEDFRLVADGISKWDIRNLDLSTTRSKPSRAFFNRASRPYKRCCRRRDSSRRSTPLFRSTTRAWMNTLRH